MGFFYRTIRIVENGIKPAYVFDGKPPDLKSGVVSTLGPTMKGTGDMFAPYSSRNDLNDERKRRKKAKKRRK